MAEIEERGLLRPSTCSTCPFRGGFHLGHRRRVDIARAVTVDGSTFHCHSEIDYDDGWDGVDGWGGGYVGPARQCAGATTLLLRGGMANPVMRWGQPDLAEDPAVPFRSWAEWVTEPDFADGAPERGSCSSCDDDCEGHTCEVVVDGCECPAGWGGASGTARNTETLEDPEWCSACGSAMCEACTSAVVDQGLPLCVLCADGHEADR